ncbi:ABC transporter ATP-binding protein [Chloroflexota bacterium]
MHGIVKRFPGVIANDKADLTIAPGEIHALLGENGAGKSTLMNVLAGLYHPDEGEIRVRGQQVEIRSPRDATQLGIGMVHQHFMLVQPQTVAENVILGLDEPRFRLDMPRFEKELRELSARYSLEVDPAAYIWQLSVGEQQRVEILKMLYRGAGILILDEPTAVLTPQESEDLGQTLRHMADEGKSIVFITHKLGEVMAFCDQVTVLRRGKSVANLPTSTTSRRELAREMVGREVVFSIDCTEYAPDAEALAKAKPMLVMEKLNAQNDKGLPALRDVSLTVHEYEILGIAGVAGNGQRELAEVITGLRPATSGHVRLDTNDVTNKPPRRAIDLGLSHVPEDRMHTGLVANMTVADNLILKDYRHPPLSRFGFLVKSAISRFTKRLIDAYEIATPGGEAQIKGLSGGNLQKALLAREITAGGDLMVAMHPTRGLDIGATEWVQRKLLEQKQKGAAILLISEDLDELRAVSDRIAVMYEGRIMSTVRAQEADIEELGLMMAGTHVSQATGTKDSVGTGTQDSVGTGTQDSVGTGTRVDVDAGAADADAPDTETRQS